MPMSIDAKIYSLLGDVAPEHVAEQEQEVAATQPTEQGVVTVVPDSTPSTSTLPLSPSSSPGLSYRTICISMYLDDLAELDSAVKRCQTGGLRRMSKSQLIRIALSRLDVEALIAEMRGQR